jgi:acid phosphatase type 7
MRWLLLLALVGCSQPEAGSEAPSASEAASVTPSVRPSSSPDPSPTPEPPPTLVAAGDIASCEEEGDAATAGLVAELDPDAVATLGDNAYPSGTDATYTECYGPTWGAFLDLTHPATGNHDAEADGGAAYHAYFGDRAGPADVAWYSYEVGDWHVVVLDSNCDLVGCGPDTPQHDWLVDDLAATDAQCTLAYWHHPRFTSGPHGELVATGAFWDALHAAGADLVLVGHDHLYERFAPQAPDGSADPDGIRQLTVGTGGAELYAAVREAPNSEVIIDTVFGVLELTLHPDAYDWRFLTVDGEEADSGSSPCH